MGSYKSVTALLRENFPLLKQVVPVGLKDPELIRDIETVRLDDNSLHSIHTGRKADIYIQPLNYITESGYTPPLGFPLSYNNISLASNPNSLIALWNPNFTETVYYDSNGTLVRNAPRVTIQNTGLRGSLRESILGLTKESPIVNLKADITEVDKFVTDTDNTSIHVDNLVKQMWPLVVTIEVHVEHTEPEGLTGKIKVALTDYVNNLTTEQAPQIAEIAHVIKELGVDIVHTPIKIRGYYLTESGLIEWIATTTDVNEQSHSAGSIIETIENDSLRFRVLGTHQISLRTCCWYTNEDLITVHINN